MTKGEYAELLFAAPEDFFGSLFWTELRIKRRGYSEFDEVCLVMGIGIDETKSTL